MREESGRLWMQALEDLNATEILITASRYYASVFFSQQVAEKALKALYIEGKRSPPPKTHNLAEVLRELGGGEDRPGGRRRGFDTWIRGHMIS
jgi:HEPN domain-containing protein